jgi:hypothetical protein
MILYDTLIEKLNEQKCVLLHTKEEYDLICITDTKNLKVNIRASCGHERTCFPYHLIKGTRTFDLCRSCRNKSTSKIMKEKPQVNTEIEYNGYLAISNYLTPYYEIQKTNEGCRADFLIRLKNSKENKWIAVQLKTTQEPVYNQYSFKHVNKDYTNHLIMCNCISDNKLWIIPHNEIKHLKINLNISINRSRYNKYLVTCDNVLEHVSKYINELEYVTLDKCMIPVSEQQKQEYEYSLIREKYISFLNFTKPNLEGTKVDFYINDLKIQEKNSYKNKKSDVICIAVNNGKENKKRQWRTYKQGENDFYWFNIKGTLTFYVIPENILEEHKLISKENEVMNKTYLNFNKHKAWLEEYKFDYKNVNKEKLCELLGITI